METLKEAELWKPGASVVLRGAGFGKIWWALSVTVVHDSPELTVLYWRAGSQGKNTDGKPAPSAVLAPEPPELFDWTWTETDVLYVVEPQSGHAVYLMRETGQAKIRCWYINLQSPLRRFSAGFEAMDQFLDIVVAPDFSSWRWKDEDEFEEGIRLGIFSAGQAQLIRQTGEQAAHLLQSQNSIYARWQAWTAPANWKMPELPTNWNSLD